jgi:hypothetical protein
MGRQFFTSLPAKNKDNRVVTLIGINELLEVDVLALAINSLGSGYKLGGWSR